MHKQLHVIPSHLHLSPDSVENWWLSQTAFKKGNLAGAIQLYGMLDSKKLAG